MLLLVARAKGGFCRTISLNEMAGPSSLQRTMNVLAGCCFAFSHFPALQSFKARGGFLYGQIAIARTHAAMTGNR